MYTVRIFEETGHTDTEYATADLAFGAIYVDPLPLPQDTIPETKGSFEHGWAIYKDGVCFHEIGQQVEVGDVL